MEFQAEEADKFCVVIPAYREGKAVGEVVRGARQYCHHVIVVDDGSKDDTAQVAREAGAVVQQHKTNCGKGAALVTGFKAARSLGVEYVITMDADGQHDVDEIPKFVEAYRRTGIPVLIGNRMISTAGMPLIRRATNRVMSFMLSRTMHNYVPDTQCGFRLYRSDILPFISAASAHFAAESETLLHVAERGIRIDSVRISTIYNSRNSNINPLVDTFRFFQMLYRYSKARKLKQKGQESEQ
jgi:glycosyltransferase involved in cell wall biosynthesis